LCKRSFYSDSIVVVVAGEECLATLGPDAGTAVLGVAGATIVDRFLAPAALDERVSLVEEISSAAIRLSLLHLVGDVSARRRFLLDRVVVVLLEDETLATALHELQPRQTSGKGSS
jgi:hypothetical protein